MAKRQKRRVVYEWSYDSDREFQAYANDQAVTYALTAAFERLGWLRRRPHDLNIQ